MHMTKEQMEYQRFDKRSKILLYALLSLMLVIVIWFGVSMYYADENGIPALIATVVLIAYTALFIVACAKISNKRNKLYQLAYGKEFTIIRTGVFKDIWEEFERNNFAWVYDGKTVNVESWGDYVALYITRNKKNYIIEIDNKELCLNCESNPGGYTEKSILLQAFDDVEGVFSAIREFIEQ